MRNWLAIIGLVCFNLFGATTTPPSVETPQAANTVLAGPTTGGNAVASFRALVAADIGANIVPATGINSNVTGTPAAIGKVLTADGSGNSSWQSPAGGAPTGGASGDLAGNYPGPTLNSTINTIVNFSGTGGTTGCLKLNATTIFVSNVKPTANAFGDLWHETAATGLGIWWQWFNDGAGGKWVSVQDKTAYFSNGTSATATFYINWDRGAANNYDILVLGVSSATFVSGTNNGTNYYSFSVNKVTSAASPTVIGTVDTSADSGNNFVQHNNLGMNASVSVASFPLGSLTINKVNAPGGLSYSACVKYKWIHP
jgi:hypothetical protein